MSEVIKHDYGAIPILAGVYPNDVYRPFGVAAKGVVARGVPKRRVPSFWGGC